MQIKVDTREKNPAKMIVELEKLGYEVIKDTLPSGDIFVPEASLLIERKTGSDFCGSFTSGRLGEQLSNLMSQDVQTKVLLVEGVLVRNWFEKGGTLKFYAGFGKPIFIKPASYNNFLLAWQKHGLIVFFSNNVTDTVHSLDGFIKYLTKEKIFEETILKEKVKTLREEQLRAVGSFPGVGTKQAIALLEKFGTVKNVFDNVLVWCELDGFGEKTEESALRLLNSPFEEKKNKKAKIK